MFFKVFLFNTIIPLLIFYLKEKNTNKDVFKSSIIILLIIKKIILNTNIQQKRNSSIT